MTDPSLSTGYSALITKKERNNVWEMNDASLLCNLAHLHVGDFHGRQLVVTVNSFFGISLRCRYV